MHVVRTHRRAFSLVEMLIATIILGLGLLMIGAVLPVAWEGSIETSLQTTADAVTEVARSYTQRRCKADTLADHYDTINTPFGGHSPFFEPDGIPDSSLTWGGLLGGEGLSYSLLGDWDSGDIDVYDVDADLLITEPATLVHALHMENWAADPASTFRLAAGPTDFSAAEAPIAFDAIPGGLGRQVGVPSDYRTIDPTFDPVGLVSSGIIIGKPVITIRDRVFPSISDALSLQDPQFEAQLLERRFAWAALHKMARIPQSPNEPRQFFMYYITLRRAQSGSRYARQDPYLLPRPAAVFQAPQALRSSEDVVFPMPWRVPVVIVESQAAGVPAVAIVGAQTQAELQTALPNVTPLAAPDPNDNTNTKIAEMFPAGQFFVDEVSGLVYRVVQRDFLDSSSVMARLTLDREVQAIDLEAVNPAFSDPLTVEDSARRNRVVWVFPPPVTTARRANDGDAVAFVGKSPVVDVRMEPLTLYP